MLVISESDLARLSVTTRSELLGIFNQKEAAEQAPQGVTEGDPRFEGFDMKDRADLTPDQVRVWMSGASDKTKAGLRVIAEHGPIVDGNVLAEVVENLSHFQSRTTIRTRTVTGDKKAFLFGWETGGWEYEDDDTIIGHYAVTPTTYASLRDYFGLS